MCDGLWNKYVLKNKNLIGNKSDVFYFACNDKNDILQCVNKSPSVKISQTCMIQLIDFVPLQ